jgi:hypothetical protein
MRRYVIWAISAVVALAVYGLTHALGLPQLIVLITTFFGALAGAVAGSVIMLRREAQAAARGQAPQAPGPDSGRKAR